MILTPSCDYHFSIKHEYINPYPALIAGFSKFKALIVEDASASKSQHSFCLASSWSKCSREKCVPCARLRYSSALWRSSITSANQLVAAELSALLLLLLLLFAFIFAATSPFCEKQDIINNLVIIINENLQQIWTSKCLTTYIIFWGVEISEPESDPEKDGEISQKSDTNS